MRRTHTGKRSIKRGKKTMAKRRQPEALRRYWAARKRSTNAPRRRVKRSRSRARRNPWPSAGPISAVLNPRRRRASRAHRHVSGRRRARRNPGGGLNFIGLPPIKQVIYGGVGFLAPPLVEGFLARYAPAELLTSTAGKYAVRVGSVAALVFGAKKIVGGEAAKMVAIGGGIYLLSGLLRDFAPSLIPGMSAYTAPALSQYVPNLAGLPMRTQDRFVPATGSPEKYNRY